MSIRTRLLTLFAIFAVAPLCALGAYEYLRAQRAVEALIAEQTAILADRAAARVRDRWDLLRSDLLLLAGNAETARLYAAGGDGAGVGDVVDLVEPYFDEVWRQIGPGYERIEVRDVRGRVLYRFGDDFGAAPSLYPGRSELVVVEHVRDDLGRPVGTVAAVPRLASLLPEDVLDARFGEGGETALVETATGRVLYPARAVGTDPRGLAVLGHGRAENAMARLGETHGSLSYGRGDSLRVASWMRLDEPGWTLLVSSSVAEFAGPFWKMRREALMLVLLVTLLVSTAFAHAIRRTLRSLEALTLAADEVGRGNFTPTVPAAGSDEVGRLAAAFGAMTSKLTEMVSQLERSRQMAAIGEFAAEISHEVRNPLTSIKLNLQRIERFVAREETPERAGGALAISLGEIERLDRVVRGILHLGRPAVSARSRVPVTGLIAAAVAIVREQAEAQLVAIETEFGEEADLHADPEQMRGAVLNLLLNALEAMPAGGVLRVTVGPAGPDGERVRIVVEDSGPGIPEGLQSSLFRPFFTTKDQGTGLGLATAVRTVEAHGGSLSLAEPLGGAGAAFAIELPRVRHEVMA